MAQATIATQTIPREIEEEIAHYEQEAQRFLRGEIHPEVFRRFRLQHGIYGQRQDGVQMVRIKIPFGGMTAPQLRRVADIGDRYSRGVAHLTTRQDIQLHYIKLEYTAAIMRQLAEVGLTTREACGNTVRNVTACPYAGICRDEVVDVTPYAHGVAMHFLRNPVCENLPRKFKIAFSGCASDCALTGIHDFGVLAVKRTVNGREEIGFRLTVGGGLGPSPKRPYLLEEWVPASELRPRCEAVLRVFNRHGNRKNRSLARLKFLIEKSGFEKFYAMYAEEYAFVREGRDAATLAAFAPMSEPVPSNGSKRPHSNGARSRAFESWASTNVKPQKQAGYSAALVTLPIGDLTTAQLRGLADITERFAHGSIRVTVTQNFLLRWVADADLPTLHDALVAIGLGTPGADRVGDVITCPGADTCGLGITSSKGVGLALSEQLAHNGKAFAEDLQGIDIKVSGCPNSCAQHHIASIGFHGLGHRIEGQLIPAYQLHLGGRSTDQGVAFGLLAGKYPAKRLPEVVDTLLEYYREHRQAGEAFTAFVDRVGKGPIVAALEPYTTLPSHADAPSQYLDYGAYTPFSLEDAGAGECAGGVINMVEQHLEDSKYELAHASVLIEKQKPVDAVMRAELGIVAAAKGLLVTQAIEPTSHELVLKEFSQRMVDKGVVSSDLYEAVIRQSQAVKSHITLDEARRFVGDAKALADACRAAFAKIDASLKVAQGAQAETTSAPSASTTPAQPATAPTIKMDLLGVACPMNYVKTKLQLEEMDPLQILEVLLDAGEPAENVPRSVKADGYRVISMEPEGNHYKLVIENKAS
ncbi:MAG: sulfurtransferase TusA family protein [Nitrospirota bacterium]